MNYLLVFLGAGALRLILGLRFSPHTGSPEFSPTPHPNQELYLHK